MITATLHENWRMRKVGTDEYMPATVPGSVYYDLMQNGKMEDPFYRDNELKALKIIDDDFEYETVFDVDAAILEKEQIILHFDGIDTAADIYLNEKKIAYVENMHRTWEFPVKGQLKAEGNTLRIYFHSPTRFIQEAYDKDPILGNGDTLRGFSYIRKASCMFGWDWGPFLPDAGIWRDVKLIAFDHGRIDSVYITQKHEEKKVTLDFDVELETLSDGQADLEISALIRTPDGQELSVSEEEMQAGVVIEDPQLWWPNGYGAQPLYEVEVQLKKQGELLDVWNRRIGLRTMTMHIEKDQYGEQFCHKVNGVKIFAMGADYIPQDNIFIRITPEKIRGLLKQCVAANHNCIRVWGGGFYPSDAFWDACDELGLVVWEDFMFACAVFNLDEKLEENITAELIDNIKRIRHHASLGLWCGNNEMEMFVLEGEGWVNKPSQKIDYVKMYEYIFPKIVKKYDPNTFYWPASPSSGGAFDEPNSENRGDVHYWDVWHGNKPITEYRKFYFRYLSEFGFQSFPALKTCESFTLPKDRNIFSYVMEKHQRNSVANGKIMNYMEQTFLYPNGFDTVLYASQLLQAEAIRYGVEHLRRNRGRCMGTVVWQLNDCWPVASWSSIDYFGRWKALHYYEKRFFAPVMLSCAEEGILTQNTNPNAQPYDVIKSIQLNVANESMEEVSGTVKWALRNADASVVRTGETEVTVPALSALWLEKVDMADADLYHQYVSYEFVQGDQAVSGGTVLFTAPKQFDFEDPELTFAVEGDEIVVRASAYARSVEIRNENEDMILSDNYFDMNAGEKRVKILSGVPEGVKVRSVYDIR